MNKDKVNMFKLSSNPHELLRDITIKVTLVAPREFKNFPRLTVGQLELFKFKGK